MTNDSDLTRAIVRISARHTGLPDRRFFHDSSWCLSPGSRYKQILQARTRRSAILEDGRKRANEKPPPPSLLRNAEAGLPFKRNPDSCRTMLACSTDYNPLAISVNSLGTRRTRTRGTVRFVQKRSPSENGPKEGLGLVCR